jgi:hypothetical protein
VRSNGPTESSLLAGHKPDWAAAAGRLSTGWATRRRRRQDKCLPEGAGLVIYGIHFQRARQRCDCAHLRCCSELRHVKYWSSSPRAASWLMILIWSRPAAADHSATRNDAKLFQNNSSNWRDRTVWSLAHSACFQVNRKGGEHVGPKHSKQDKRSPMLPLDQLAFIIATLATFRRFPPINDRCYECHITIPPNILPASEEPNPWNEYYEGTPWPVF